jgi:hypothetical protein
LIIKDDKRITWSTDWTNPASQPVAQPKAYQDTRFLDSKDAHALRILERFVHFALEGNPPSDFPSYLVTTFSWHRFLAVSLWILALFLIYVTATEFSHLFGPGELRRLFFTSRPFELQLNRRQRFREMLRLSRLMDAHSISEFRDPTSLAHQQLIDALQPLARK